MTVELPATFPVIDSVPVPVFTAPYALALVPPVTFPMIAPVFGEIAENVTHAVPPAVTFPVNVTPADSVNPPLAVAPPVASVVIASHALFTLIVTVRLLAIAVSPATGTDAPGAPAGVVAHVDVALKLPEATAKRLAIGQV